jgi:hypothetical protein
MSFTVFEAKRSSPAVAVNEFVPFEATYQDTELVYAVPDEHVACSSKVDAVTPVPIKVDSTVVDQIQNEEEANSVELKVLHSLPAKKIPLL